VRPLRCGGGRYGVATTVVSAGLCYLWLVCGPEILAEAEDGAGDDSDSDRDGGSGGRTGEAVCKGGDSRYGAVATADDEEGRRGTGGVASTLSISLTTTSSSSSAACIIEGARLESLPFAQQLRSSEFALLLLFQTVHTTRANLYLGLLAYFFDSSQFKADPGTDPLAVASAVNVASALVPLGCLCAPLVERLIDSTGFAHTAHAIAAMGALQSLVMLSGRLGLQLVSSIIFLVCEYRRGSAYRAGDRGAKIVESGK